MAPFTLEKENLILVLWQLQQAGQDFRIKEVDHLSLSRNTQLGFLIPHPCSSHASLTVHARLYHEHLLKVSSCIHAAYCPDAPVLQV